VFGEPLRKLMLVFGGEDSNSSEAAEQLALRIFRFEI
jgi:hypothetical protein